MFDEFPLFAWSPGMGDPTFRGWFTVFAYFAAMLLCFRAFLRQKAGPVRSSVETVLALFRVVRRHFPHVPPRARRALFWLLLAMVLLLLGVNKQLDLQTLITEVGRHVSKSQGWYQSRRGIQVVGIGFACFLVGVGVALFAVAAKGALRESALALLGLGLLGLYVVMRALSFHSMGLEHLDFLAQQAASSLEVIGITMIGWGAHRASSSPPED